MARKIRKNTAKSTVPPIVLFVELLVPWIVMGIVAVALSSVGVSGVASVVLALIAALAATFFIRYYERRRKALERLYGTPQPTRTRPHR